MNKIKKSTDKKGNVTFILIANDGSEYPCTLWHEKKTDKDYIKLPKDNPTGRTYVTASYLDDKTEYEFDTKLTHREGLASGGWKSRLTPDELDEFNDLTERLNELKTRAQARKPYKADTSTPEGIEAEIARLIALKNGLTK